MRPRFAVLMLIVLAILLGGCGDGEGDAGDSSSETRAPSNMFEVVARGLAFEAPGEASSGWVTFRFRNESDLVHFALVERLPDGVGIAEH